MLHLDCHWVASAWYRIWEALLLNRKEVGKQIWPPNGIFFTEETPKLVGNLKFCIWRWGVATILSLVLPSPFFHSKDVRSVGMCGSGDGKPKESQSIQHRKTAKRGATARGWRDGKPFNQRKKWRFYFKCLKIIWLLYQSWRFNVQRCFFKSWSRYANWGFTLCSRWGRESQAHHPGLCW